MSIGDVSSIVGYADKSILTRRFTEWSGMTPSDWRAAQVAIPI
jgi:AraC-like DNA-binding protein